MKNQKGILSAEQREAVMKSFSQVMQEKAMKKQEELLTKNLKLGKKLIFEPVKIHSRHEKIDF